MWRARAAAMWRRARTKMQEEKEVASWRARTAMQEEEGGGGRGGGGGGGGHAAWERAEPGRSGKEGLALEAASKTGSPRARYGSARPS